MPRRQSGFGAEFGAGVGAGFGEGRGPGYRSSAPGGTRHDADRRLLKIGPGGRVVIPAEFRKAMEIAEGDTVVAFLEDGELKLISTPVAVRKAQAYMRQLVPEGVSLVDELIADRRREAEEDRRDG